LPLTAPSLLTLRADGTSAAAMHPTVIVRIAGISASASASSARLVLYVYQNPVGVIVVLAGQPDSIVTLASQPDSIAVTPSAIDVARVQD
jgi:hypothetical protein